MRTWNFPGRKDARRKKALKRLLINTPEKTGRNVKSYNQEKEALEKR